MSQQPHDGINTLLRDENEHQHSEEQGCCVLLIRVSFVAPVKVKLLASAEREIQFGAAWFENFCSG